jgi:hypothetical protein
MLTAYTEPYKPSIEVFYESVSDKLAQQGDEIADPNAFRQLIESFLNVSIAIESNLIAKPNLDFCYDDVISQ